MPLLHAEQKVFIRINKKVPNSEPRAIFEDRDSNSASIPSLKIKKQYFLSSELMTDEMKETLEQKFVEVRRDKMPEVSQMVKSEWQMVFSQKKGEKGNTSSQQ